MNSTFTSATDKLNVDALTTSGPFDAQHTEGANAATAATIANGKIYLITAGTGGFADGTGAATTQISAAGDWTNGTDGNVAYFIVVDDNSTGIFKYTEATGTEVEYTSQALSLNATN